MVAVSLKKKNCDRFWGSCSLFKTKLNEVKVDVAINIAYGYSIPEVSAKVQDKVKAAIENMTGLTVAVVNVRIASVDMGTDN